MTRQAPSLKTLINMLQKVKTPEDITKELWMELKTLTTLMTYQIFLNEPGTTPKKAIKNAKAHFNAHFDQMAKEIENN
ncbi:MAG: hypothetical protein ACOCUL_04180 [Bacteroidota bacterium]